jgi:hypothetical protein
MKTIRRLRETWWCPVLRSGTPLWSMLDLSAAAVREQLDRHSLGWFEAGTRIAKLRVTEVIPSRADLRTPRKARR